MSDVKDLEKQKSDSIHFIELKAAAIRLYDNADFKKLILDEFCLHECARYAQQSAHPGLNEVQRADALLIAQAPGALKRFLSAVIQKGNHGEQQMSAIEQAIIDAEEEEAFPQDDEE